MPILSRAVGQSRELIKRLDALSTLPRSVVKWRYSIENDWSGDPAIFFYIVLSDEAINPNNLRQVTSEIRQIITNEIESVNDWELFPYFSFRSQSEQAKLKDVEFE